MAGTKAPENSHTPRHGRFAHRPWSRKYLRSSASGAPETDRAFPISSRVRGNYFVDVVVAVATTTPRSVSPFSNCGPHILSQSMNRLTTLPIKLFLPYIAHVTMVLSPRGLKVKSTGAVP